MDPKQGYIAVFDSGVGGISVLRQLLRLMPKERYWYYGDSAHAPYGTRPVEEVRGLALQAAEHLMAKGIKALVVACNTATAAAIEVLRQSYPDLIVVGIEPAIKLAADRFPGGTVGVIATPVTLREEKYHHLADHCREYCQLVSLPAPGLADLVEAGKANSPESEALLRGLLEPWAGKLDALVLGCTHYPFAADTIRSIVGEGTALLDGGEGTAAQTRRQLEKKGLLWDGDGEIVMENSANDPRQIQLSWELLNHEGHTAARAHTP